MQLGPSRAVYELPCGFNGCPRSRITGVGVLEYREDFLSDLRHVARYNSQFIHGQLEVITRSNRHDSESPTYDPPEYPTAIGAVVVLMHVGDERTVRPAEDRPRHTLGGVELPSTASTSGTLSSMIERLHHMQLAMPPGQEATVRDFYSGVLGMTEIDKPLVLAARGGAWFRAGSVELHLGVEDDFRAARKGHPGILVTDLDEVVDRLRASGQPPTEWDGNFPGCRRVYAHDPFGNRLEFLQPSP